MTKEAIIKTRELSRGLLPVGSDPPGLTAAVSRWSGEMQTRFGVECHFFQDATVRVYADKLATHLFRIAQDAVNNSIKHGRPKRIDIKIASNDEGLQLSITDDGVGIPEDLQRSRGLGLQIMNYRARIIGATLQVERMPEGGTIVICKLRSGTGLFG